MSQSRHCAFFPAENGKWYMELGDFEHAEESHNCTTYGPFDTLELAEKELDNHSNPGSSWTDNKVRPVPTKSGNGSPIQPPRTFRNRGYRPYWA
jgi:hypothetical protein